MNCASDTENPKRTPATTGPPPVALIHDDDSDQRDYFSIVLGDAGFKIVEAESQDQFEHHLAQHPDLVVLDLMLVGHNAVDILHRMAALECQSTVVFVSSQSERLLGSVSALGARLGLRVAGHLRKPVLDTDLSRLVDEIAHLDKASTDRQELERLMALGRCPVRYQPQFDIEQRRIIGLTAVAELDRPGHPSLSGDRLAVAVRDAGLGRWFHERQLEQVLQDLVAMREQGLRLPVTVPVGHELLAASEFHLDLKAQCLKAGLLLSDLRLAIAERELAGEPDAVLESLVRLGLFGCGLVVDQVQGPIIITELPAVPCDEVRICPRQVARIERPDVRQQVLNLAEQARNQGVSVAADGVKDEVALGLLVDLGVTRIQGPLLATPRPTSDLKGWLSFGPKKLGQYGLEVA